MSKRIKLTPEEIANLNNNIVRSRLKRMGPIILNEPLPVGSGDGGGEGEVIVEEYIISIATINSIRVPVGTAFGSINFSDYYYDKVKALASDDEIVECSITWSQGSYSTSAGTYTINGTLIPPNGYSNSGDIVPEISIQVVSLESGYQSILDRATTLGYSHPTPINQGDQNALYAAISSHLSTMDAFYCTMTDATSNFWQINWKTPASNQLSVTGGVTLVSRKGIQGNGTTGFVSPSLVLSGLTNYTLNSAGFGCYVYNEPSTGQITGCVAAGARLSMISSTGSSSDRLATYEINGNTNPTISNSYCGGLYHVVKTAAGTVGIAKNSGLMASGITDAAVARPTVTPYILARNNNGTADSFCDGIISMWWIGANHSANVVTISNAWQTYLLRCRIRNTYSTPVAIGEKINDTFARASLGSNYITSGTATFAPDGSKLVTSGGTPATYTNRCKFKYGHSFEVCQMELTCQLSSTPSASTGGIGVGFSDFAGGNGERSVFATLDMTSGSDAGKVKIVYWNGSVETVQATSSAIPSIASGDSFNLVFTKSINGVVEYEITATRVSDSAQVSVSFSNPLGDSTGDFCLLNFGGTVNVSLFKVTVSDMKYKKVCFVGDSLTHGYAATTLDDRYASNVLDSYEVSGGSGDTTSDVVGATGLPGKIKNLLEYEAEYYAINLGGNDIANAVSSTIWQNNLRVLIGSIKNDGRRVILLYPFPRDDGNVASTVGSFFDSTFASDIVIDEGYIAVKDGGTELNPIYDNGDGVHMNSAGHLAGAAAIQSALPILY